MKKLINIIKNEKGITLVELLATLVIVSIIGALAYSVLFQGYSNYQRIQVETELRDEADFIMANLMREMFIIKKNDIAVDLTCTKENDKLNTYIEFKSPPPPPPGSEEPYAYGFVGDKVKLGWKYLQLSNSNITLLPAECEKIDDEDAENQDDGFITTVTESDDESSYTIKFSLKTKKGNSDHIMQFENTVQIVVDSKEVEK